MRERIYFIDENDNDRFTNGSQLEKIFCDAGYEVILDPPLKDVADYAEIVAGGLASAFIVDQNMRVSGHAYDGIELAKYIRALDSGLPIYILTASKSAVSDIGSDQYLVDDVFEKRDLVDVTSDRALSLKGRLIRHVEMHSAKIAGVHNRFADLLRARMTTGLGGDEEQEFQSLRAHREDSIAVAELARNSTFEELESLISEISEKFSRGDS